MSGEASSRIPQVQTLVIALCWVKTRQMKKEALKQARERLEKAQQALRTLKEARSLQEMRDQWHDLLLAASTVFSKLEQGAKGCGQSEAWFGKRRKERKDDPLLRYVQQARNSAEHSLQDLTSGTEISVSMRAGDIKAGQSFGLRRLPDGTMVPATTGDPTKMQIRGRQIRLVPVQNRGVEYNPPNEHLGQPVSNLADDVGSKLVLYLEAMLTEAAKFET